ncbi:DnaJ-like protein [Smittium mucronatum]|uniref:DnaJ-like protein n=1 Tax=Smittium mucronatum TaxID=133383 RepID=A0A1R0GWN3_9FUNG|nr:DnaJ-like protein [Smittium mucronatum]
MSTSKDSKSMKGSVNDLDVNLDNFFKSAITQINRSAEVERILKMPKIDPFSILEVDTTCDDDLIKKAYRHKSRLVHPDKTQHPKAVEAFDILKQAQDQLLDQDNRRFLLKIMSDAESILRKELSVSPKTKSSLPNDTQPPTKLATDLIRSKFRSLILELEWQRKCKATAEAERKAAELLSKEKAKLEILESQKRAREWEQSRDDRINSWRSFQSKTLKKTGKKKVKKSLP